MTHVTSLPKAYEAPAFLDEIEDAPISAAVTVVGTIAIILAFFASVWAWCWFVCRGYGGLASCEVGWFKAKAVCKG